MERRGPATVISLVLCLLSVGFLLAGKFIPAQRRGIQLDPLPAIGSETSELAGSGFSSDGVYPTTPKPAIRTKKELQFFGSWVRSDASTGSATSAWYAVHPRACIWIAGYPSHAGVGLWVEVFSEASHNNIQIPLSVKSDPAARWVILPLPLEQIRLPAKFRIVAIDQSKQPGGWIGFSTPFLLLEPPQTNAWTDLLLVVLTTAAAIVVFVSPGLLVRSHCLHRSGKKLHFVWIPIPGVVFSATLGLLAWAGPRWASGTNLSIAGIVVLLALLARELAKDSIYCCTTPAERKVLFVSLLVVAVAVAKATYSVGPVGELYQGTISRTLEVGDRSDSRISYHVVQLVSLRQRPHRALAALLFSPWSFSSRGPIAGLAVSPVVLASGARVSTAFPEQDWTIFDPEGFMAYRIAMIVLATSCLLIVFGFSVSVMPEEWATLAFVTTLSAPFIIHEIYFTWPKLEAASCFLLASYLTLHSRWFVAGLVLGLGYLFHPAVLLFIPALICLLVLAQSGYLFKVPSLREARLWAYQLGSFLAGLSIWLILWRLVNRNQFDQTGFINYFWQTDLKIPTFLNWVTVRIDSLLNTLLPLNLFLFHRNHPAVNALDGHSPAIISFFFQYWTALPFGIGIFFFFCLLRAWYLGLKRFPSVVVGLYVVPFFIFAIYWGPISTGLLREGLHCWFLGVTIGSVVLLHQFGRTEQRLFKCVSWILLFRGAEVLAMLLLPAVWTQHKLLQPGYRLTDLLSLLTMTAGVITLSLLCFFQSESLRKSSATTLFS